MNEHDFGSIDYWATVGLSGQRSRPQSPDQTNNPNELIKLKGWAYFWSYWSWSNSWLEWSKISAPIVDLWLKWQRSPMSMQPRISLYQNIMRTAPARISKPDYVVKMSPALSAAVHSGGGGVAVAARSLPNQRRYSSLFFLYLAAAKTKGNFTILG